MKKEKKNQNLIHYGFTLIEMIIVLIIIGIMLLVTLYMSGEQIQKVKDKTVKEAIVAEMQSRYSRNLWSSSIGWKMYNNMEIHFSTGENNIDFKYNTKGGDTENSFIDRFEIRYIARDYDFSWQPTPLNNISLKYTPYKISCDIDGWYKNIVILVRVNDHKNYCFEINEKNCRLTDVSAEKCETMAELTNNNL